MSKTDILSSIDLAKGLDIVSGLDLRFECQRARRKARLHLALMLTTAAATLINFHPDLQIPVVWAVIGLFSLLLARSLKAIRAALHENRATKEASKQIQALLIEDAGANQAFAYKISAFQPTMKLRVATITKDNMLCVRTYNVAPGEPARLTVEERQVYAKAWLNKTFGQKWVRLATDRGISVPRARDPQVRFGRTVTTPGE